jgi:hypothetical protein
LRERDEKGRFIKGSVGNPKGRPPKAREERYYEITLSTVTFADWEEIIRKAADQAKRGDYQARKFLAEYLVGPPVQRTEILGDNIMSIEDLSVVVDLIQAAKGNAE